MITKQNRAAFESALEKNGLSSKEAKLAVDYLSDTNKLSDAEKHTVETDERYQDAIAGALAEEVLNGNNNITKLDAARNGKTFEEYLNSSVKNDTINESEANTDEGVEISIKITIRKSAQKNMFWVHAFEPIKKASGDPADTNSSVKTGYKTTDLSLIVSQKSDLSTHSAKKVSEGKASIEFSSPEEAKVSGKISDANFSIEFADAIANNQRKYAEDGLLRISSEELEKAIADTAHMVNEMKPYANILPQDKVDKAYKEYVEKAAWVKQMLSM